MAETATGVELNPNLTAVDQRLAIMAAGERRGLWTFEALLDGRYLINRAEPDKPPAYETLNGPQVDKIPFDFFVQPINSQGEPA